MSEEELSNLDGYMQKFDELGIKVMKSHYTVNIDRKSPELLFHNGLR